MTERPAVTTKSAYESAEERLHLPVCRRGLENENPPELSFWQLLREDFETHDHNVFEQGFWAVLEDVPDGASAAGNPARVCAAVPAPSARAGVAC